MNETEIFLHKGNLLWRLKHVCNDEGSAKLWRPLWFWTRKPEIPSNKIRRQWNKCKLNAHLDCGIDDDLTLEFGNFTLHLSYVKPTCDVVGGWFTKQISNTILSLGQQRRGTNRMVWRVVGNWFTSLATSQGVVLLQSHSWYCTGNV